jgi:hypothetical protein
MLKEANLKGKKVFVHRWIQVTSARRLTRNIALAPGGTGRILFVDDEESVVVWVKQY